MKALYDLAGDHEEIRRAVVSRLYYAAHHLSRLLLRKSGLRTEAWRRDIHRRVIHEIDAQFVKTGQMDSEVLSLLKAMRRLRVRADYQLRSSIHKGDTEEMFSLFRTYLDACKNLLEGIL